MFLALKNQSKAKLYLKNLLKSMTQHNVIQDPLKTYFANFSVTTSTMIILMPSSKNLAKKQSKKKATLIV